MAGGEEEEEGQWSVRRNVYLNVFYAFYVDGIRGSVEFRSSRRSYELGRRGRKEVGQKEMGR